jgi:hypothetical protein
MEAHAHNKRQTIRRYKAHEHDLTCCPQKFVEALLMAVQCSHLQFLLHSPAGTASSASSTSVKIRADVSYCVRNLSESVSFCMLNSAPS